MRFMDQTNEKQGNQNRVTADIRGRRSGQKSSAARGHTGLSQEMKEKYESISGYSFDDVRVHYNSDKPARIQALAYTQGNQVYLMPGQERHLEHELGHVIQQKRGIVKPTGTIGGIPVNEDAALEAEAGMYGKKAYRSLAGEKELQSAYRAPVAQRYKKAGRYTVAAAPGEPPEKRLLMVRDNEPGALYIHTTATEKAPGELKKLGILPGAARVNSPLPDETPRGQFQRYEQGRIPKIIDRAPVQEELTLWQKIKSIVVAQTRTVYNPQQQNLQPERVPDDQTLAETRLQRQRTFLKSCLKDEVPVRNRAELRPRQAERWQRHLDELSQTENSEDYISLHALGEDVYKDVKAVRNVAEQRCRQVQDYMPVLDIAREDLEHRLKQVQQEIRTIKYVPQIPTACNTSASMRSRLINGPDNDKNSVKAEFDIIGTPYDKIANWNYHFATPIPAGTLTKDMLIIEDAVGKSSSDTETMNAHWAAHIYGAEESDAAQGVALDSVRQVRGRAGVFRGISRCRFNQMSVLFRKYFCGKHHIRQNNRWSMEYRDYSTNTTYGTLHFCVNNDWKIVYELEAAQDMDFTPGMQHFLIATADAIAEDFVLAEFADENLEKFMMGGPKLTMRESPKTRSDSSYYSLEEIRLMPH